MANQPKPLGRRNHDAFADRYAALVETKPHNAHYDRPATLSLLPDVRGLRVLDAGCGPGVYAAELVRRGARVTGIDVTPRMIELAAERLDGLQVELLVADLERPLPFADDAFDLVLSALALDYVADWRPTFREFRRVLRPNGALVASFGHPQDDWRLWPEGNYFDVEPVSMAWHGFGDPPHVSHSYRRPLAEVINPLIEAGFVLERLLEPRPTEAFRAVDPKNHAKLDREPGFLGLRARAAG